MTDETTTQGAPTGDEPGSATGSSRPEWFTDAEDALERIGDAVKAAWETTRDTRMSALESARQAANQLGEAIDRGIETARERWQAAETDSTEEE